MKNNLKKLLTLMIALTMVMSFSFTSIAAETDANNGDTGYVQNGDDAAAAKAREELGALIAEAEGIEQRDSSNESFKALMDAVAAARLVYENANATEKELHDAADALLDAEIAFVTEDTNPADTAGDAVAAAREVLKKAIQEAEAAAKEKFTGESLKTLTDAIDKAKTTAANTKAKATELLKAASDLGEVVKSLKEKDEREVKAARESLNAALDDARKIEKGNYTDESFQALQDAIAEAEKVSADDKATASDLKAAEEKVAAAKASLKEKDTEPSPKVLKAGDVEKVKGNSYKVTSTKNKTVSFKKAKKAASAVVPATVKLSDGKTYKVTAVEANAFTAKKIRNVTIGKNVKKIKAKAFRKSKVTTITLKTKLLKKSTVKDSLKGSKVKTIKVRITKKASGSTNKKYIKKYKKIFTKKNAGRKVTVK